MHHTSSAGILVLVLLVGCRDAEDQHASSSPTEQPPQTEASAKVAPPKTQLSEEEAKQLAYRKEQKRRSILNAEQREKIIDTFVPLIGSVYSDLWKQLPESERQKVPEKPAIKGNPNNMNPFEFQALPGENTIVVGYGGVEGLIQVTGAALVGLHLLQDSEWLKAYSLLLRKCALEDYPPEMVTLRAIGFSADQEERLKKLQTGEFLAQDLIRFILGHEMAHLILGHSPDGKGPAELREQETAADSFVFQHCLRPDFEGPSALHMVIMLDLWATYLDQTIAGERSTHPLTFSRCVAGLDKFIEIESARNPPTTRPELLQMFTNQSRQWKEILKQPDPFKEFNEEAKKTELSALKRSEQVLEAALKRIEERERNMTKSIR